MKTKKILSIFCIALILFLFGCTMIAALTGSPYFMPLMFLSFFVPFVLYIFLWLYKLTHPKNPSDDLEKEKNEC